MSFPRTRGGDPTIPCAAILIMPVFPAHAGVIPNATNLARISNRFPRTRGGDPPPGGVYVGTGMFSPHTRG